MKSLKVHNRKLTPNQYNQSLFLWLLLAILVLFFGALTFFYYQESVSEIQANLAATIR